MDTGYPGIHGSSCIYFDMYNTLLADVIVIAHLAYACFVLFGCMAIVIGGLRSWQWIKNVHFRTIHLACTVVVPLETILGITCPLTTLENALLRASGEEGYNRSFFGNLASRILFYNAPEWVFAIIYITLGAVVIICYILYPPTRLEGTLAQYRICRLLQARTRNRIFYE